jgi:hypothetical protein
MRRNLAPLKNKSHEAWNMKIDLVEKCFKYIQILTIDRRKIKFNLDGTNKIWKRTQPY